MLLQVLAGLSCLLAAIMQFAVYRSPDILDTSFTRAGRRIMIGTMFAMAVLVAGTVFGSNQAMPLPVYLLFGLVGLSQSLFAMRDLLPHLEKEYPWTSHLTNSR